MSAPCGLCARCPSDFCQPLAPVTVVLGLIAAQAIYVWLFWQELYHLLMAAFGSKDALHHVLEAVTVEGVQRPQKLNETVIMLVVLGLIDVVMISNLLIMVIVGGYETFVSRCASKGIRISGMALARERVRSQGEASDGNHRHLLDPPAEDLHQRRCLRCQDHHRADGHSHHLPVLSPCHCWADRLMAVPHGAHGHEQGRDKH